MSTGRAASQWMMRTKMRRRNKRKSELVVSRGETK
jgi:hypothetical protein